MPTRNSPGGETKTGGPHNPPSLVLVEVHDLERQADALAALREYGRAYARLRLAFELLLEYEGRAIDEQRDRR